MTPGTFGALKLTRPAIVAQFNLLHYMKLGVIFSSSGWDLMDFFLFNQISKTHRVNNVFFCVFNRFEMQKKKLY